MSIRTIGRYERDRYGGRERFPENHALIIPSFLVDAEIGGELAG